MNQKRKFALTALLISGAILVSGSVIYDIITQEETDKPHSEETQLPPLETEEIESVQDQRASDQDSFSQEWDIYENELYRISYPSRLQSDEYRDPFSNVPEFAVGEGQAFTISISIEYGIQIASDEELKGLLQSDCQALKCSAIKQITLGNNTFWGTDGSKDGKIYRILSIREPQTSFIVNILVTMENTADDIIKKVDRILATLQFKDLSQIMQSREVSQDELDKCKTGNYSAERDCYTALAYNKGNYKVCEKMLEDNNERQANRAFCLGFMAVALDNIGACREQENMYYQNTCEMIHQKYFLLLDQDFIQEFNALRSKYSD